MRSVFIRITAAVAALGMIAVLSSAGGAGAATKGLGTSNASTSILSLQLGKGGAVLNLGVLVDKAVTTIDPKVASPHALSQLVPVELTSQALPALNAVTAKLPRFESRQPGGDPSVSGSAIDLASASSAAPVPGLLGGAIGTTNLKTALNDAGALSSLDASLAKLSVLKGVLGVESVKNGLGAGAAPATANADRGVNIGAVSVLNLGELLEGLKLDLEKLPISTISELVKTLKLPVALPTGVTDVNAAVTQLLAAINQVIGTIAADPQILDDVVKQVDPVKNVVNGLPAVLPVTDSLNLSKTVLLDKVVSDTLATLQTTLTTLLDNALSALGNLKLLEVNGADVSVVTKAVEDLAGSSATATGKVGDVTVLGLKLPGVDLLAVGNLVNTVTSTLGSVLTIIDPALKDLVKVSVLEKTTSVANADGYNRAIAGIDVLKVQITPPPALANLVSSLTGGNTGSVGTLSKAGVANPAAALPVLGTNMAGLNALPNVSALGALADGALLRVGAIQSTSEFAAPAAPGVTPRVQQPGAPASVNELPRTGANTRAMAAGALVLALLAVGIRRSMRRPAVD
jgi:hypothetical protein